VIRALLVFSVGTLAIACCLPSEPQPDHACDREKRAVWSALGHEDEPPASLMAQGEWNLAGSDREPLEGETYYFMVQPNGSCRVLRA
jgi:hypothetical protein